MSEIPRCPQCRGEADRWTVEVPCCGAEYECVDFLDVFRCVACKIGWDAWGSGTYALSPDDEWPPE